GFPSIALPPWKTCQLPPSTACPSGTRATAVISYQMIKTTQETVDELDAPRSNKIWHALAGRALARHGSSPMFRHALSFVFCSCVALSASTAAAQFQTVQYRGMAPGWPNQQAGNYTAYYAPQYGQPMYYVARPAVAAYANPAYFGGYNVAPVSAQQPLTAAYYAPPGTTAYYAPPGTTTYYAPPGTT